MADMDAAVKRAHERFVGQLEQARTSFERSRGRLDFFDRCEGLRVAEADAAGDFRMALYALGFAPGEPEWRFPALRWM